MKKIIYIICGIILLLSTEKAFSQCCAAGNPASTNCSVSDGGENRLNVGLSHLYSISNAYYTGANKENDKVYGLGTMDESYFNFTNLSLSYGLTGKLGITADIGYFVDKAQKFYNGRKRFSSGLADVSVGLIYNTYKSDNNLFEIKQSARVTLPVGEFYQEYKGVVLPIDFQPSSGNYKYNLGLILRKSFEGSKFSLLSTNSVELSQLIENDRTHYKYGNLYNLSLIAMYGFTNSLSGALQLRCEVRDKALSGNMDSDSNYIYTFQNSTGGVLAYISPQVNYTFLNDFRFSLQYNQPVYKNVNGEQLTNKYSVLANLAWSVDFSGKKSVREELTSDNSLSKVIINVSGSCEMCKARIESTVNEIWNVAAAEWEPETKKLTIFYNNEMPDLDKIEKALADAGHDNEKYKASDAVYNKLPKCCHYR